LAGDTRVAGENNRSVASNYQTLVEIGRCKVNYHKITTTFRSQTYQLLMANEEKIK